MGEIQTVVGLWHLLVAAFLIDNYKGTKSANKKGTKNYQCSIPICSKFTNIQQRKVNKKAKIIFFCMVFVAANAFSQNQEKNPSKLLQQLLLKIPSEKTFHAFKMTGPSAVVKQIITPNYYTDRLGYFCKQEIKFEKNTRIPLRFRLGSVVDCDRLEGKYRKN
jgi:hypothetical protein